MIVNPHLRLRFMSKVRGRVGSTCWIWTAYTLKNGYGRFGLSGKTELAHRVSWLIHKGLIPEGMQVLHSCDVRNCVNPEHLFLGTNLDNMNDKVSKGRASGPKGLDNHKAFLTEEQVKEIRKLSESMRLVDIAELFSLNPGLVGSIVSRRTWRHV